MMLTNAMFWHAIDNLAAAHHISCSRLAQISGMDITALNKCKRISPDGKQHWMSVGSLAKIMNATNTSWRDFADYFPPERRAQGR